MRKRFVWVLFLLNLAALVVTAQLDLSSSLPTDPAVKIGKLPNGLTYYIKKNAKPENKVELRLAINAGSLLERDDQQGVAHFLEHMAFNGTKRFKKNDLISNLQSMGVQFGADLNAYTTFDETVFVLPIPTEKPENLDKGLEILQEWASSITLDQTEIEREKGVVLEELRLGQGAAKRMLDKYLPLVFKGSRYSERLPIGKKVILENLQRQAILDFYEEWYRPDLMAVVAVGNLNVEETERKIRMMFSGLTAKRGGKPRTEFDVPDHKETLITVATDKEAAGASVTLIYKKPPEAIETKRDQRRQLMMSFYSEMLNARLSEIAQSPNPPFIGGNAAFGALARRKGSYMLFGFTDPKNIRPTLTALLEENRRVKEFGFLPSELERQKDDYLSMLENLYAERENTESVAYAGAFVGNFLQKNPIPSAEFIYEFSKAIVPTITIEEVNALAKETISDSNRVIVVTGAESSDIRYPDENEIASLLKSADSTKLKPFIDNVSSEPLIERLETTAKFTEERKEAKFGITYLTLSNGVKVALKPTNFKADEVRMEAFSPGGLSIVDDKLELSGKFADSIGRSSGVKSMSLVQLNKMLAGKNAGVNVSITELFEYMSGSSTIKDLETMFQLAYLRFTDVNFDRSTFDSFIGKQRKLHADALSDPGIFFNEEVNRIMAQNHPRVKSILTAEQLDTVSLNDAEAVYRDRFGDASDFTFVFVGNFENEKIKPLILKYLGSLPAKNRAEKWKDLGIRPPAGRVDKVVRKGVDQKSLVRIRFIEEAKYDVNDSRLLSVLGELLTNKLIEILREDKAGVYGVSASGGMGKSPYGSSSFTIDFPCGPENVSSLIDTALAEVEKIQKGQIDEKDLNKVKESRLVKARENVKTDWYWMSEIVSSLQWGTELNTLDEIEKRISTVTRDDIQRVANKYLKIDQRKQFVLMPENPTAAKNEN